MRLLFLIITVLFTTAACQVVTPTSPAPTLLPEDSGPHFLLQTAGPVQLNRDSWSTYYPVGFGAVLYPTDLVKVENGAAVLCVGSELAVKTLAAGEQRVPCPPQKGILTYKGVRFSARRAGAASAGQIPFVLYPRNTLLLDDRPTFFWNDTGAGSYTVILTQAGQEVWRAENVAGATLPYPDDRPPLEQNKDYRLVVIDNDSQLTSRQYEPPGVGFRLAMEDEKSAIEDQLGKIRAAEDLTDVDRAFALGVYYAGLEPSPASGFRPLGEAWLAFSRLAETEEAPAIHLWRGDVLTGLRLPEEVIETAYQTALTNAEKLGDVESQAGAKVRLWCLTEVESYLNEAIDLYQHLNNRAEVERLEQGRDDWAVVCK